MSENISIFILSFLLSGFAGLAALLRSGRDLTAVKLISALLNSGLLGLGICLYWYSKYREDVYTLVGICVLAGLSGQTMIGFAMDVVARQASAMFPPKKEDVKAEPETPPPISIAPKTKRYKSLPPTNPEPLKESEVQK